MKTIVKYAMDKTALRAGPGMLAAARSKKVVPRRAPRAGAAGGRAAAANRGIVLSGGGAAASKAVAPGMKSPKPAKQRVPATQATQPSSVVKPVETKITKTSPPRDLGPKRRQEWQAPAAQAGGSSWMDKAMMPMMAGSMVMPFLMPTPKPTGAVSPGIQIGGHQAWQ